MLTGYVPGGFDMLHIGHLNILNSAAARCDRDGGERAGEHQDWREPPGASSSELGTRQPFWVKV